MSVNMKVLTALRGSGPALERSAATRRAARSAPMRSKLALRRSARARRRRGRPAPRRPRPAARAPPPPRRERRPPTTSAPRSEVPGRRPRCATPAARIRPLATVAAARTAVVSSESRELARARRAPKPPALCRPRRRRSRPPPAAPATGPRARGRSRLASASTIARRATVVLPSSRRRSASPGCGSNPSSADCRKHSSAPVEVPASPAYLAELVQSPRRPPGRGAEQVVDRFARVAFGPVELAAEAHHLGPVKPAQARESAQ